MCCVSVCFFVFKQKTADEMRISDWSSDVCSSDLFYRHGDIGRFDEDGFLTLMDRAKDMIISGGFNIFPSDLEAILIADDRVVDAAVVGIPSEEWGETPVAFVVLKGDADAEAVRADCNAKVGKTQRLSRSEEHTSELQSLMRSSYAVFCLKKK